MSRSPNQLWIEGGDDEAALKSLPEPTEPTPDDSRDEFTSMIESIERRMGVGSIVRKVRKTGFANMRKSLPIEAKLVDEDAEAQRLGVVIDANGDPNGRWATIRDILESCGCEDVPEYLDPSGVLVQSPGSKRVGVWLLPDNKNPGALEDFIMSMLPMDDELLRYATEAVDGVPTCGRRYKEKHRQKALLRVYLGLFDPPGMSLGIFVKGLPKSDERLKGFAAWMNRAFT